MAHSSSSGISLEENYEVFLSFRGEDTRNGFISHLYSALTNKNVRAFRDDDKLPRGKHISPSLLSAIDRSKIAVVVFSPRYASSTWCLDELVHIVKCKKEREQIVIPVFYHVQPRDVRWQSESFGAEFAKCQRSSREKSETWKKVLTEVADLSGWDLKAVRDEAELVQKIVKDVREKLTYLSLVKEKELVGVDKHIHEIESLLCIGSNDVFTVGIWGIVGVGKSTIATEIYHRVCKQFDWYRFIDNVGKLAERNDGLTSLRKEIHAEITFADSPSTRGGTSGGKTVFMVFDNVTQSHQIKRLTRELGSFGPGSRIVIISRDEKVLTEYGVDKPYKLKLLHDDALKLFRSYAFGDQNPGRRYLELSAEVVRCAEGSPFVLKILGSFLSGKLPQDWEDTLKRIKGTPNITFREILKICYNRLQDREKTVFLQIASSLNGAEKDTLQAYNKIPIENEINALVNKHLITITNNQVVMHDLLEDIGQEIFREFSANQFVKVDHLTCL